MPAKSGVTSGDVKAVVDKGVEPAPAVPSAPRFGVCEGTREEVERLGQAVDPFTGKTVTKADLK
jgi:hypothetical protein